MFPSAARLKGFLEKSSISFLKHALDDCSLGKEAAPCTGGTAEDSSAGRTGRGEDGCFILLVSVWLLNNFIPIQVSRGVNRMSLMHGRGGILGNYVQEVKLLWPL